MFIVESALSKIMYLIYDFFMEHIPTNQEAPKPTRNNNQEKPLVVITEDSEYFIIDTGAKKRYVPKWEKIPVNGVMIDTQKLVRALALYPNDSPTDALEKMRKEHPEIK